MAETEITTPASQSDIVVRIGAEGTIDELRVVRMRGTEGISQLYRIELELASDRNDIDIESKLSQPVTISIVGGEQEKDRWIHGIIGRFERLGEGYHHTEYYAEVVPAVWRLTQIYRSRIHSPVQGEEKTIPDIIKAVLAKNGFPEGEAFEMNLKDPGAYLPREFSVQYRETDFNYISRLMEAEGMFYYFDHTKDGHKMIVGDDKAAYMPIPGSTDVYFRDVSSLAVTREHIYQFRTGKEIRPGGTELDDFNYRQPTMNLKTNGSSDGDSALLVTDWPGGYIDSETGKRLAQVRAEEFGATREFAAGRGSCRRLTSGKTFTLKDHPYEKEYLITQVTHRGSQPQNLTPQGAGPATDEPTYEAQFECVPASVIFRPRRLTPRPIVRGLQTARVVGEQGEEIYTDDEGYGRVKVQFNWDREGNFDQNSSCWIRVSHGSAGGQYGMMFLPRIGQEVLVAFFEGDPDDPVIVGRVYNGDLRPPYTLPDEKTKSVIKTHSSPGGGGTNLICFEDLKDKEQLFIHAHKDLHIRAKNDHVQTIGHEMHVTVVKDSRELVKENKEVEVKLDLSEKVGGKRSVEVTGDVGDDFKGKHSEKVSTDYYLNAGSSIVIEAGSELTLKVGGNFVKIDSGGVTIMGTQVKINSGGSAGSGSAVALKAPQTPNEANTAEPGADVTYSGGAELADGQGPAEVVGIVSQPTESEQEETSWIEIEMVDDSGQPWPNERYEITTPDGKVKKGSLNRDGWARESVSDPGNCQICFPDLDQDAWERM